MLFEVAIVEKPTKKDAEDGKCERLVFGPKAVIAKDAMSAAIGAVLDGAQDGKFDRDRIEVLTRPFA